MSAPAGAGHLDRQEIIIVRRRHGGEEGHHGGAWKIAFADFMTAMMALFLVMWLTNSSDNATRKQVAQYFNPIKLNDASPAVRGVETKDDGASPDAKDKGTSKVDTTGDPNGKPLAGMQLGGEEQALFRDPYAVLAEIAAQGVSTDSDNVMGKPDGSGLPGLNGGDAYRDPFDPSSWQLSPNVVAGEGDLDKAPPAEFQTVVTPAEAPAASPKVASAAGSQDAAAAAAGRKADAVPVDAQAGAEAAGAQAGAAMPTPKTAEAAEVPDADQAAAADAKTRQDAEAVKADIREELAKSGEIVPQNLEVSAGPGGITISLTDDLTNGMFAIGSARPTPAVIQMMEKIAAVLAKRPGNVVIRGHTDSRPFHNAEYDNWRLSAARAQMAYYMLTRGGLDEARVKGIEGIADRDPKLPDDPEAAANRRIEILLTEPTT